MKILDLLRSRPWLAGIVILGSAIALVTGVATWEDVLLFLDSMEIVQ